MEERDINLKKNTNEQKENQTSNIYLFFIKKIVFMPRTRNILLKKVEKIIYRDIVEKNTLYPKKVQIRKYQFIIAALERIIANIDRGYISKEYAEKIIEDFIWYNMIGDPLLEQGKANFEKKYGVRPPSFLLLSPTQKCGFKCVGCYASANINAPTLSYNTVEKVTDESYTDWGNRFMTLSGGEPLMYKSEGKTLFDIFEKYPKMFFHFYTNGMLITKEVAEKMNKLGNVTPAISIEGYEKETDKRRGKGVYKKILKAAKNLREAGVPFGVSITATTENFDLLMEDKFYDFLFQELGATYMWIFQLMPIGQARNMKELMINPEQRVKLFREWEHLLEEKKYPVADFWNSGILANGCIAYGRSYGYLYIDWNGNIMPCPFVPFYEDNIMDLYSKGKKLTDALFSDLFKNGRKWQDEFGLAHTHDPDNWLMPCSIRDHFSNFKKNILTKNSKPEDKFAKEAIESKEYEKVLKEFDKKLEEKTLPIWKKEYLDEDS